MFDPYSIVDNINGWFGKVVEWLGSWFQTFASWFDPAQRLLEASGMVVEFLPMADARTTFIMDRAVQGLGWVVSYIGWLDWFVELQMLLLVCGLMLSMESMLILFRLWRMLRSTVI